MEEIWKLWKTYLKRASSWLAPVPPVWYSSESQSSCCGSALQSKLTLVPGHVGHVRHDILPHFLSLGRCWICIPKLLRHRILKRQDFSLDSRIFSMFPCSKAPLQHQVGKAVRNRGCHHPLWVFQAWRFQRQDHPRSECSMVLPEHGTVCQSCFIVWCWNASEVNVNWCDSTWVNVIKCVVKLGFVSNHLHSCTLALSLFSCPASTLVISSTRTPAKGPSFLPSALEEKLRRDKTTAAFSRLRITNLGGGALHWRFKMLWP